MKLRSFRLRIALLSAALAGTALVGFAMVSWRLIYVAKVNRLDAKLENQVMRAARPRSGDRWQSFEASLPRELGTEADTPIEVWVIGAAGETLYQSQTAPPDLNIQALLPPRPSFPVLLPPEGEPANRVPLRANRRADGARFNRIPEGRLPEPRITTHRTATGSWRVGAVSLPHTQVAIAVSLQAIHQEMAVIQNIFLISIPGLLLLMAGGAWIVAGSALHPIQQLTTTIRQVTIKGLDQRVPAATTDVEFKELIQVFNQMLEHLERSFKQASRFSGDAAHELKTPLAILQGELERMMQQAESGSEMQQNLSHLLDEVRRLSGIVRKLLLLSLADAGQMRLHRVAIDVSELLMLLEEDLELLAPQLDIHMAIATGLTVWGDRDLLTQVLHNLVSNAIKYNLPNGWIRIQAERQATTVKITITNASNGILKSDRDRIFDRFYRGDPAHTRQVEGVGLGLSLSREIARAHRGDLRLNATPHDQTALTLTLPASLPSQ